MAIGALGRGNDNRRNTRLWPRCSFSISGRKAACLTQPKASSNSRTRHPASRPSPPEGCHPFESNASQFLVQLDIRHVGAPIGFTAFTTVWHALSDSFDAMHIPVQISMVLWYITVGLAILIFGLYTLRAVKYPYLLRQDFTHKISTYLFAAPGIVASGLLVSTPKYIFHEKAARALVIILVVCHAILSVVWISKWLLMANNSLTAVSPLYFMGVINFFTISSAATFVGFIELATLMFMTGAIFWFLVFISVFIFYGKALHSNSAIVSPTLVLFVAPPAVAAVSWIAISEVRSERLPNDMLRFWVSVDGFLYVLMFCLLNLFRRFKFDISSWAYVFPICSAATLSVELSKVYRNTLADVIVFVTSAVSTLVFFLVAAPTLWAFCTRQLPKCDVSRRLYEYERAKILLQGSPNVESAREGSACDMFPPV